MQFEPESGLPDKETLYFFPILKPLQGGLRMPLIQADSL